MLKTLGLGSNKSRSNRNKVQQDRVKNYVE